ncbi:hypothetical protein WME88_58185 [Sorangium sp. So ce216]
MTRVSYNHENTIVSIAEVQGLSDFTTWMKSTPRSCKDDKAIFGYMANGNLHRDGRDVVNDIVNRARNAARDYVTKSVAPAFGELAPLSIAFDKISEQHSLRDHERMKSLSNMKANQVRHLNDLAQSFNGRAIVGWVDRIQAEIVEYWFAKHALARLSIPTFVYTDAQVRMPGAVRCSVYRVAGDAPTQVGACREMKGEMRNPENHAERRWMADFRNSAFDGDRIDFHISIAPCERSCAKMLMDWLNERGFKNNEAYVFTYRDPKADGSTQACVYRLKTNAMLHIGNWNPT